MTWRDRWEALRESPEDRAYVTAQEARHSLAVNVYTLRKERGLSQTALARLARTKQPNISDIETADSNVTIQTLGKLAAALGVSVADLFEEPRTATGTETASPQLRLDRAVYVAEGFAGFQKTQGLIFRCEKATELDEQGFAGMPGRAWS